MKYILIFILLAFPVGARDIYYGDYSPEIVEDHVDVPLIALSPDLTMGILGRVRIGKIPGSGKVVFDRRTALSKETIQSVLDALEYVDPLEQQSYFVAYDLSTEKISGRSGGAAVAIGAKSIHEGLMLKEGHVAVGSIDPKGRMQETGGILLKIKTAHFLNQTLYMPEQPVYDYHDGRFYALETDDLGVVTANNINELFQKIYIIN